ncbi:MAG: hypothetical protein RBS68_04435 [Anaerolineales bacterium]|jgi:tetratricopeptide (TPR) repeat protein|nr:hypothetical protein [Anaerolineales bacterium]
MAEYDNDMLRMGIIHYKSREFAAARNYFERALLVADDHETRFQANLYLSRVVNAPAEKRHYLEEALALNPSHNEARRALAILDGKLKQDEIVDPDALPAQPTAPRSVQADRFTCPQCGARMVFDGDGRTLVCEYCARNQTLDNSPVGNEQDFIVAMATGKGHRKSVARQTFHCKGCGANFILPPNEKSAVCAYCASAHVIRGDPRELVEPDAVVPIGFKQREAIRYLVAWMEKNKITPQGKVQPPRGVYLPVWTFDIVGSLPWKGLIYRNKKYISISDVHPVLFNDISIPAVTRQPALLARLLPEFDLSNAPAYDPRYLAGWPAEVYERVLSDASLDARQEAIRRIQHQIKSKRVGISDLSYGTTDISIVSFKLVFIPVWITEYLFEEQLYPILINGVSGQVHGKTPQRGVAGWLGNLFGG